MLQLSISVVTVCLNDLHGLRATFESLFAQRLAPHQWIVADGGSNDGTSDWLASLHWPPLMWTSERDGGIYAGMNRGLEGVTADYVLFLNSGDTLIRPDVLERVHRSLATPKDPPPVLLYGDCIVDASDAPPWIRRARPPTWTPFGMPASHQAMFFRVVSIAGGFDTRYRLSADYALVLRLYRESRGADFLQVEYPVCRFRPGGRSDQRRAVGLREDLAIRRSVLGMSRSASRSLHALHLAQSWVRNRLPAVYRAVRGRLP